MTQKPALPAFSPDSSTPGWFRGAATASLTALAALAAAPLGAIVGGEEAEPGAFPFLAAVVRSNEPNLFLAQFAAGTLVHPSFVLTSAGCLFDAAEGFALRPEEVEVAFGVHNLTEPGFTRLPVAEIFRHPDYDPATGDSDLALLLLEDPVTEFPLVELVTDPGLIPDDPGIPEEDLVRGTIAGWGNTNTDLVNPLYPDVLHRVEVPLQSLERARANYGDLLELTENMLPAGFDAGGADACLGDCGGPLLVADPGDGRWLLAGTVSFGISCAEPGLYGIYTRVTAFRPWVLSITRPNYAAWELAAGVAGERADPDADGLPNLLQYALGAAPGGGAPLRLPRPVVVSAFGVDFPGITYDRPAGLAEVTYTAERSINLRDWVPLDEATFGVEVGGGELPPRGFDRVGFRADIPLDNPDPVFLRLRVAPSGSYVPTRRSIAFPAEAGAVLGARENLDPTRPGDTFFAVVYDLIAPPGGVPVDVVVDTLQFGVRLQLLDGVGLPLGSATGGPGEGPAVVSFTPEAGRVYAVRVSSQEPFVTGRYLLSTRLPLALPELAAPGAGTASVAGQLDDGDDEDPVSNDAIFYKDDFALVGAGPGEAVEIVLSSGDFDAFLTVHDADSLELLYQNDDAGDSTDSALTFTQPAGRRLIVRVSTYGAEEVGSYSLSIRRTRLPELVPGDNGALELIPDSPIYFRFGGAFRFADFRLPASAAGKSVRVEMRQGADGLLDPFLELVNARTGEFLLLDDDGLENLDSLLVFDAEPGVDYLLRATQTAVEAGVGQFTINLVIGGG